MAIALAATILFVLAISVMALSLFVPPDHRHFVITIGGWVIVALAFVSALIGAATSTPLTERSKNIVRAVKLLRKRGV